MRCRRIVAAATLAAAMLWSLPGCRQTKDEDAAPPPPAPPTAEAPSAEPAPSPPPQAPAPLPIEKPAPPPKPVMPKVVLSEALASTSLVKVGDTLPQGAVTSPEGQPVELSSTFGQRLTVLYFWKGDSISALEGLRQIVKNVGRPYADKGVAVVPINEKDSPAEVAEKLKAIGEPVTSLLDADGAYFAKLATEGLPRVYLVDQQGKILWFDTEFSLGTEHALLQAIEYTLAK